ncbi:hypothetical protein DSM106972_095720 [Dulcicalothrix desertica PCC 7102]|uniref:DUF928 domain-containing protein n=1 Tax=Dulcicalothrix desertica PCC 7102 TaxID=232991 RepID=A0A3S1C1K7_9CYAN|nr:hypothetical protein DSM106972_095720 [Dulcicalothrix desertica PCC 7102]
MATLLSIVSLGTSLSTAIPLTVLANTKKPPPDQAPTSGRSSGSRGCGTTVASNSGLALILLSPTDSPAKTVLTRPTFAWFVRDNASVPMEFRLYERENNSYKLVKEIKGNTFKSTSGITVLTLALSAPSLEVGKQYRWQVALVCDSNRPSGNLFASSDIQVAPIQPSLKSQLERVRDNLGQAKLYAQENLLFDALGIVLKYPGNETQFKDFRLSLFNNITAHNPELQVLYNSTIRSVER